MIHQDDSFLSDAVLLKLWIELRIAFHPDLPIVEMFPRRWLRCSATGKMSYVRPINLRRPCSLNWIPIRSPLLDILGIPSIILLPVTTSIFSSPLVLLNSTLVGCSCRHPELQDKLSARLRNLNDQHCRSWEAKIQQTLRKYEVRMKLDAEKWELGLRMVGRL